MDGDGVAIAITMSWSMVAITIPGRINNSALDQIVIAGVPDHADVATTDLERVAIPISAMQLAMT